MSYEHGMKFSKSYWERRDFHPFRKLAAACIIKTIGFYFIESAVFIAEVVPNEDFSLNLYFFYFFY